MLARKKVTRKLLDEIEKKELALAKAKAKAASAVEGKTEGKNAEEGKVGAAEVVAETEEAPEAEAEVEAEEEPEEPPRPKHYYNYRLKGVVVHQGRRAYSSLLARGLVSRWFQLCDRWMHHLIVGRNESSLASVQCALSVCPTHFPTSSLDRDRHRGWGALLLLHSRATRDSR